MPTFYTEWVVHSFGHTIKEVLENRTIGDKVLLWEIELVAIEKPYL